MPSGTSTSARSMTRPSSVPRVQRPPASRSRPATTPPRPSLTPSRGNVASWCWTPVSTYWQQRASSPRRCYQPPRAYASSRQADARSASQASSPGRCHPWRCLRLTPSLRRRSRRTPRSGSSSTGPKRCGPTSTSTTTPPPRSPPSASPSMACRWRSSWRPLARTYSAQRPFAPGWPTDSSSSWKAASAPPSDNRRCAPPSTGASSC